MRASYHPHVEVVTRNPRLPLLQGALPLRAATLHKVGLFGPFAADPLAILGNYFSAPPGGATTFVAAMQAALGPGAIATFNSSTSTHCTQGNIDADVTRCQVRPNQTGARSQGQTASPA